MSSDEPHRNAKSSDYDIRLFARLLTPSSLSLAVCILLSLLVVGGIATITGFQGSSFQRDFLGFQRRNSDQNQSIEDLSLTQDYGQLNDNFANSNLVRNIPVMAFWMFVGTLVYFAVTGVGSALGSAKQVGDELHYVHARRQELLRDVFIKTAIRLVTLICWLLFIAVFVRVILPYVLAAAHIGGGGFSLKALPYLVLSFIILTLSLHIHIVMLRLVALRPRLFSEETSF